MFKQLISATNFIITKNVYKDKMSHLAIHFLLLTPLLLLATVSNGLNTSSAATADTDNQLRLFFFHVK
jgi:hypothetical protein